MDIARLCLDIDSLQASDLFLDEGRRPSMRRNGGIVRLPGEEVVTGEDMREFFRRHLPPGAWERFTESRDLDLGVTLEGGGRFRINLSFQRNQVSLAVRRVPNAESLDRRELRIPEALLRMAEAPRGLVLITGATGCGKTTTLAALLHHINTHQRRHVVTLEDPIEYIHEDRLSLVSQREIGNDCRDFPAALKAVVRQNPDAIFLGELRDLETVGAALSAALTGHLVVTTIHTGDVLQTLERILNHFPEGQQPRIAQDLSLALLGIASQRLVPGLDGRRRAAFEILRNTPAVQRLIAGRSLDAVPEMMRISGAEGMVTFSQSLLQLHREGLVSRESAAGAADSPEEFQLLLEGMRTGVDTLRDAYSGNADFGLGIKRLLGDAVRHRASDLILTVGSPPVIRLDGVLRPFDTPVLTPRDTRKLLFSILSPRQRGRFETEHEIDFALSVGGLSDPPEEFRFRVNGFYQKGRVAAAFRLIPSVIPDASVLGIPPAVLRLCRMHQGLVLITGPTGHGKSTTLAALIDVVNRSRACHIITLEDPIEFVHVHQAALVEQREIGSDSASFARALKYILRQDPDIILIGEMRDPETIAAALTAAETGHLVFATLHTNDVAQSVDRIVDVFPADRQNQIRAQLAATLEAVVSQRLVPLKDGSGRVAAFEILLGTVAVRNVIRERKTHQLAGIMEASAKEGMITMERALQNLLAQDRISPDVLVSLGCRPPDGALPFHRP